MDRGSERTRNYVEIRGKRDCREANFSKVGLFCGENHGLNEVIKGTGGLDA